MEDRSSCRHSVRTYFPRMLDMEGSKISCYTFQAGTRRIYLMKLDDRDTPILKAVAYLFILQRLYKFNKNKLASSTLKSTDTEAVVEGHTACLRR